MMTVRAYSATLGSWADGVLAIAVLLFGLATVICWAYYGQESISMLGLSDKREKTARRVFNLLYAIAAYIGAVSPPGGVWILADFAVGVMTIINIITLIMLRRELRDETKKFTDAEL